MSNWQGQNRLFYCFFSLWSGGGVDWGWNNGIIKVIIGTNELKQSTTTSGQLFAPFISFLSIELFYVLCSFCLSFNLFLSPPPLPVSLGLSLFNFSFYSCLLFFLLSFPPFFACSFFFLLLLLFSFFLLFCLHFLSLLFSFIVCLFLSTEEILYWNICNSPQTTVSKIFILIKMSLSSATKNKLKTVFKKYNKNIV